MFSSQFSFQYLLSWLKNALKAENANITVQLDYARHPNLYQANFSRLSWKKLVRFVVRNYFMYVTKSSSFPVMTWHDRRMKINNVEKRTKKIVNNKSYFVNWETFCRFGNLFCLLLYVEHNIWLWSVQQFLCHNPFKPRRYFQPTLNLCPVIVVLCYRLTWIISEWNKTFVKENLQFNCYSKNDPNFWIKLDIR